jgi:RNA polymerase sigma factor (sigma-70 family)
MTPWALIRPARLAGPRLLRTQSDARLVDLVRAGNDRAFEAIVIRYQRQLLRHCRRLLPAGRAEDAVQQAFLSALESMRADRRELQLSAWLHRIAHNTAIDALRRHDSDWAELDERIDGVEPTHAAAERRARFRSVVAGLDRLPERQRRALVLRELEGRSYEEIADELGVTGAGVRQLLNRARNAMRSGASVLVPPALLARLAGSHAGVRVAELVDPPGTSALLAKATAAVAAGAVALVAVTGPGERMRSPQAHARPDHPAQESRPDAGGRAAHPAVAARSGVEEGPSLSRERSGRRASVPAARPQGEGPAPGPKVAGSGGERSGDGDDDAREPALSRRSVPEDDDDDDDDAPRVPSDPPEADDDDSGEAASEDDEGMDDDAPVAEPATPDDDASAADDDHDSAAVSAAPPAESDLEDDDDLD